MLRRIEDCLDRIDLLLTRALFLEDAFFLHFFVGEVNEVAEDVGVVLSRRVLSDAEEFLLGLSYTL